MSLQSDYKVLQLDEIARSSQIVKEKAFSRLYFHVSAFLATRMPPVGAMYDFGQEKNRTGILEVVPPPSTYEQ